MTKLQFISDLHIDFYGDCGKSLINSLPNKNCDALIVAGDIAGELAPTAFGLKLLCDRFPKVIYVLGNHEYYWSSFKQVQDFMEKAQSKISNLCWLEDKFTHVNGVKIVGSTLWFQENEDSKDSFIQAHMSDFSAIKHCDPAAFLKHEDSCRFIKNNTDSNSIVVTHHLPSFKCVSPRFERSLLNCFFASDLDSLIDEVQPKYWLCGHSHDCRETIIGKTKIIRNPWGYPNENNVCNKELIIEI